MVPTLEDHIQAYWYAYVMAICLAAAFTFMLEKYDLVDWVLAGSAALCIAFLVITYVGATEGTNDENIAPAIVVLVVSVVGGIGFLAGTTVKWLCRNRAY